MDTDKNTDIPTRLDVILALREKLKDPKRWTTDTAARDISGKKVLSTSPNAVSWCLLGAIDNVLNEYSPTVQIDLAHEIRFTIASHINCDSISSWQDGKERKHRDIINVLDELINKLK